ncbi:MAG: PilC/PilY family type IV pilus protein [Burkholderiales bacterium]
MNRSPRYLLLCAALLASGLCLAAPTSISNVPLGTTSVRAKPNIMFILDDSGSMASTYMPDDMDDSNAYGFRSAQCNGNAYDPSVTYSPPVDYQGTSYADATFTNAWKDGFNTGGSKTNLNTTVTESTYFKYKGSQTKMDWRYKSNGSVDTSTTFYTECNLNSGTASALFESVLVRSASTEAQNYANWYAYYRTRLNLIRTAVGHAFIKLDDNYRIGFTMISDTTVTSSNFLDAADFTAGSGNQKSKFYSKLYNSYSGSYTPLRGALSKVGQYYGKVAPGQSVDPVQYSCQRNYAILSTDGYWNSNIETSSYGPYDLSGSLVGQQDGNEARPMKDSATSTRTVTTTTLNTVRNNRDGTAKLTSEVRRVATEVQSCTIGSGSSAVTGKRNKVYTQKATQTDLAPRTQVLERSRTDKNVAIWVNGVKTSDTTTYTYSPSNINSSTLISNTIGTISSSSTGSWSTVSGTTTTGSCVTTISGAVGSITYAATTVYTGPTTAWNGTTPTPGADTVATPGTAAVTDNTVVTGGASNSLADVAEYYWATDLRSDLIDNVGASLGDNNKKQHMNTFTLGLGVRGTISYDANYLNQTSGDYADLKSGTKNWPNPGAGATMIDDLWHAAVNGRGQYFSATSPDSLTSALSTTLAKIQEQVGAGAAAAASTLTPTVGDDWIFLPSYAYNPDKSLPWYGDLRAFKFVIDSKTGAVSVPDTSSGKEIWSAKSKLDGRATDRAIYFRQGTSLLSFTYDNLTTAALNGSLDNRCTSATPVLTQCTTINATAMAKVTGANLVNFLRGDTSLYLNNADTANQVFRTRASRLGDFINASPVYVGKPPFKYVDSGYASFVSSNSGRSKMVYAGANDGMLHAFKVGIDATDVDGGTELWAFVPTAVVPEMWRLADSAYDSNHRYFVDATPVVGDVFDGTQWRTILVGGLGAGGRAYYALDITDPTSPKALWEISSATTGFENLGLTYGNPVITKNKAGTWIVAFTSGLNNISTGDGVGRLYTVNAATGAKLVEVSTGAGDSSTPNNLSRIEGWVDATTNNTVLRFYGGDMLGNMWRFDHDDRLAPSGAEAMLLGTAKAIDGTAQPITSKPVLTALPKTSPEVPVIAFGTGRYLGTGDLSDATLQTVYAIKDPLGTTGLCATTPCVLRSADAKLVQQTLGSDRKVASPNAVSWSTQNGWYVDLSRSSGERIYIDGEPLSSGVLAFASAVPGGSVCSPSGVSYLYQFNVTNGVVLEVQSYNTLVVGLGRIVDPSGNVSATATLQDQTLEQRQSGTTGAAAGATLRRASWRELID